MMGVVQRPLLPFVLFLGIFSAIVAGVHYYLWQRLIRAPELGPTWQRVGSVALWGLASLVPLGLVLSRALPRPIAGVVAGVVYTWVGLAVLLFFLLLTSELVRLGAHGVTALLDRPLDGDRRTFLSRAIAGAAGVLAMGLGITGAASALGEVAVRPVRVRLRRLPRAMSGFRVVQLTDLHIGPTIGRAWLERVVARVNALEPDVVAITGDLVDGSVEELREHTAPLADLRARHGVFFVTGNHEYYSGIDAWVAELGRLGVRVLRNERVSIGHGEHSFDLAGVDDWSARGMGRGHGPDLARALAGRDPSRELVLLAHQPKQILEAERMGVGLQLSGHTHGGQIFPWGLFVRLDQPYVAGLSWHGQSQIYVSRGTGYWGPPMRVGAPSEITLIELDGAALTEAIA
ncbi:serine/threonine protein phosphatase [Sorangium cellulosum]|uniref:Serine/threonine protein phosphatase n=1 Tax=Sorangium cellulosum TaxID=56 RepID=A0A4P2Q9H0_SORCE|nr:serine/threonine protein phosphatase [Sorangium cellulosum]